MLEPEIIAWSKLTELAQRTTTRVWATTRARSVVAPTWSNARWIRDDEVVPEAVTTLVVIGGGTFIDNAKRLWRTRGENLTQLIAVPTIWGSGAEASPVVVWTEDGKKQFQLNEAFLPSGVSFFDRFAETINDDRARAACGDVWAHALEGFLAPIGSAETHSQLAALLRDLMELDVGKSANWFRVGARAAFLQSQAAVGLVHGIAHTLEPMIADLPEPVGHAELCAMFLVPVMRFNAQRSPKFNRLFAEAAIDTARLFEQLKTIGDSQRRLRFRGAVEKHWNGILRNPCTRTNSTLVRPESLAEFIRTIEDQS